MWMRHTYDGSRKANLDIFGHSCHTIGQTTGGVFSFPDFLFVFLVNNIFWNVSRNVRLWRTDAAEDGIIGVALTALV